jgi:hypothetical protein
MYYLSVGAIFKNEGLIMREWIRHYLYHGVEHFYLINDDSDDNYLEVLEEFKDKVTLFQSNKFGNYHGRQKDMYSKFILPKLNETHWLLMVDLDEFLWSEHNIDLRIVLRNLEHLAQIQVHCTLFGSAGYEEQPNLVVKNFTKRAKDKPTHTPLGGLKYFVNSKYKVDELNVHYAKFNDERYYSLDTFQILDYYFTINHYNCQSRYFWNEIKCKRGDADEYKVRKEEEFDYINKYANIVDDFDLYEQNKSLF